MRPALVIGLGLACVMTGFALGWALGGGGGAALGAAETALILEAELAREREAVDALRDRLEALETRLAEADAAPPLSGEFVGEGAAEAESHTPPGHEVRVSVSEAAGATGAVGFDEGRLLALRFHPSDIERLREAWESLELERIFLENARARSKKRDGRHWLRIRALEEQTLGELGESDYDAVLYAAGGRNRVTVARVFPESPAEEAGYEVGDQILSYGEVPLFAANTLKTQTARCELGKSVAVTVLRDGSERRLWTPCGPLGLQLEMANAPPR